MMTRCSRFVNAAAIGACAQIVACSTPPSDVGEHAARGERLAALAVASAQPAALENPASLSFGPPQGIVSASGKSVFEAETKVAVASDGTVAVVFIADKATPDTAFGVQKVGYTFWRPGSSGWTPVRTLDVPGMYYESDPIVVADHHGNFHMAWIAAETPEDGGLSPSGMPEDNVHVYYAFAPRGAHAFGTPRRASAPGHEMTDKPWFVVTRRGTILLSYTTELDFDNQLFGSVVARSTDLGETWTRTVADPSGASYIPFTCYDEVRDRVYMVDDFYGIGNARDDDARGEAMQRRAAHRTGRRAPAMPSQYPDGGYDSGPGLNLLWSDDDGVTWPPSNTNFIVDPYMASLSNCAAHDGDVWVQDDVNPDGIVKDTIHVRHFTHGGAILESDTVASTGDEQLVYWQPQIVRENGGALDILYYAAASYLDPAGSFRLLRSTDRGKTWAPPRTLFAPIAVDMTSRHSPTWLGDYIGLLPVGRDGLYVSFARTDAPDSHVGFLRVDGDER